MPLVVLHFLVQLACELFTSTTAVASSWATVEGVHHPNRASVLEELLHIRIVAGAPSLPLTPKEFLYWALAQGLV